AHCSGIPVVGSRRGGLPEAIGNGGVILDYDAPLADWVAAIRRLWTDKADYDRMSAAARLFAERPQMNPDNQFATFMDVLNRAVEGQSLRKAS
ncbi:MAG: glycosyl transferase family 1, partial [Mesorhizobium sp.]